MQGEKEGVRGRRKGNGGPIIGKVRGAVVGCRRGDFITFPLEEILRRRKGALGSHRRNLFVSGRRGSLCRSEEFVTGGGRKEGVVHLHFILALPGSHKRAFLRRERSLEGGKSVFEIKREMMLSKTQKRVRGGKRDFNRTGLTKKLTLKKRVEMV